ncbi:MAG: hypothetical protein ABW201_03225 [Candidatus Thiodiazotropha sp.]
MPLRFSVTKNVADNALAWVVIALGISLCWPSLLVKPELFSMGMMFLIVWLYYRARAIGDDAWKSVYLIPLIMVVWVNTHGAFFLSSLFFASTFVGELFNMMFSSSQAMSAKLRKHYFIALLLCALATLINPYGMDLPLSIINLVTSEGAQDYRGIKAYLPTYMFNEPPFFLLDYLILLMIVFVVLIWQKLKIRMTDWVVIISFIAYCVLFTQMIRTTYFLAPVFMFASLDLLSSKKNSILWPEKYIYKYTIIVIALLLVCLIVWRALIYEFSAITDPVGRVEAMLKIEHEFPQAESEFIRDNMPGKNIGNSYHDGGYLIYQLWPDKKLFVDPRYFPFKSWIKSFLGLSLEGGKIDSFIKNNDADAWLINHKRAVLIEWFIQSNQWSLAFIGPVGCVFVPSKEFSGMIEYSIELSKLNNIFILSEVFTAALMQNNIDLAKNLRTYTQDNVHDGHVYKDLFISDLDAQILGMEALTKGEYRQAAELFSNSNFIKYAKVLSAKLYRTFAIDAWNTKNYSIAREWSIAAYVVMPEKILPDIYNLVLTDWHSRNSSENALLPDDGIEWKGFAELLIKNKKKTDDENLSSVAESMLRGNYNGDAYLYQHSGYKSKSKE